MSAIATGLLLFLQLPPAPGLEGRDLYRADAEWAAVWIRAGRPQPKLALVAVPAFEPDEETGEIDVEALWSFLVSPDTPWTRAQAAIERLVPDRWHPPLRRGHTGDGQRRIQECFVPLLPRFVEALHELRREAAAHRFGLRGHPHHSNLLLPFLRYEELKGQERIILGRPWTVPPEFVAYPIWWEEHDSAPWPWRVKQVLEAVWQRIVPRGDQELSRAWVEVCLGMPWDSDDEAVRFVMASTAAGHESVLAVLARWRAIALDPTKPEAADILAASVWHRTWTDGPSGQLANELMIVDFLTSSPHERVRWEAASVLEDFGRTRTRRGAEVAGPLPAAAILAAAELACGSEPLVSTYSRLDTYALRVCFALEDPPIPANRGIDMSSPEVPVLLDTFCQWFARERPRLEELAAEHAAERDALRARLEELAR